MCDRENTRHSLNYVYLFGLVYLQLGFWLNSFVFLGDIYIE